MGSQFLRVFGRAACICLGTAVVLAGCQRDRVDATAPRPGPPVVIVNGQPVSPEGQPIMPSAGTRSPSLDRALKSDPCAAQLHEISGAMLQYQAVYDRLPRAVEDLQKVQGPDDGPLNFTCPTTGEAYVYVPAGLRSPDDARQIVLHDRSADSAGLRWVILMQPARGQQAAATWVMRLTEPEFRAYVATERGEATPARRGE